MRRFFVEEKTSYSKQQKRWSAGTRRLICAFIVRTYIKAGFLSDSRHRSSTSCTTFVWTTLQWRTNIHTLKLLYGQLFNGVLIYTHWNIGSTFVHRWIRNWVVVKVTFSKTVRGNEEWQIESVIKKSAQALNKNMLKEEFLNTWQICNLGKWYLSS